MPRSSVRLAAMALIGAVAAGGCGVGPGDAAEGEANLRVTRDFGVTELADATLEDPTESETVVRFLDRNADIETSFGGNFVESIDGLAGSTVDGGQQDWFFFVNGYYSDIGAGEAVVRPGDRIWWDFREWSEAYRVPAVVGSWPEPFLHGSGGERLDVVVECVGGAAGVGAACQDVVDRLSEEGVQTELETVSEPVPHPDDLRILVGAWGLLRADPAAAQLEDGPSASGVYARFGPCDVGFRLEILGPDAQPRETLATAGLVAAVREGEDQATWLVTASDATVLDEAAALLDAETLIDRYAVATDGGGETSPVPAPEELPHDTDAVCG